MIVTTKLELRAALCLCALLILISTMQRPVRAQSPVDGKTTDAGQAWAAVAPGVVEPRSGQVKIAAPVIGRVSDVMVKINDKVAADQPLVRLDDEDAEARVASAQAQVAMREKARNEKSAGKAANRRDAEDAVADAEAALRAGHPGRRNVHHGDISESAVEQRPGQRRCSSAHIDHAGSRGHPGRIEHPQRHTRVRLEPAARGLT